jgi:ribosome recycling factor
LNEERRKQLVKSAKATAEQSRLRCATSAEAMDELKKLQKSGAISEDELKDAESKIQKMTDSYIAQINSLSDEKEKEIMEI